MDVCRAGWIDKHDARLTRRGDADRRSDLLAQDVRGGVDLAHVPEDTRSEAKSVVSGPAMPWDR